MLLRKLVIIALVSVVPVLQGCSHTPKTESRQPASEDFSEEIDDDDDLADEDSDADEAKALRFNGRRIKGLYVNGKETVHYALIDAAKKTIDIEIYEMSDVDFLNALRRAIARKVRVRVVKDPTPVGNKCPLFGPQANRAVNDGCENERKFMDEVVKSGGSYKAFIKENLCGVEGQSCFQHGKLIIVDGRAALVSSGNFNSSNLCNLNENPSKCNRDYSFVTRNRKVIAALTRIFEKDDAGKRYSVLAEVPVATQKRLTVSPHSLDPLRAFIRSAKKSVAVQNQYLKDPELNEALLDAAKSGIDVKITLASACSFGRPSANEARKLTEIFTAFDTAGINTRMHTSQVRIQGRPGYMHAKAIVIDGKRAWMGSINGSTTSLMKNREYGLYFHDRRSVRQLVETMDADFKDPGTQTWEESIRCAKD